MKIKINLLQKIILGAYIIFNTYALVYLLTKKITFGDFSLLALNGGLIWLSYFSIIIPFVGFGYFLFPFFERRLTPNNFPNNQNSFMNIFVLILQCSFLVFNLATGVNKVGSTVKTDSLFKYVFIIFQPDTIFFILYGNSRDNKYFKYNIIVYIISSIQMGWMSGIAIIFLVEMFELIKRGRVKKRTNLRLLINLFIGFMILLLVFPFILVLRSKIRGHDISAILGPTDYFSSLKGSIDYLFGRMQHLSSVYLMFANYNLLVDARSKGEFVSCFAIGLPQQMVYKTLGINYVEVFGYIFNVLTGQGVLTSWTHVGWIGLILPELQWFGFFILYTILLIYIAMRLAKMVGGANLFFILWLYLVMYLLHGWIQNYVGLIQSLFLFFLLQNIAKYLKGPSKNSP